MVTSSETVVFERPWGTNTVTLTYEGISGRYLPPGTRLPIATEPKVDLTVEAIGIWRYRLYLGAMGALSKLVLWESHFKNLLHSEVPENLGVLAYYIAPDLERAVVLAWDHLGPRGDITVPGATGATNILSPNLAAFYPSGWGGASNPDAGEVSRGTVQGTYDASVVLKDGGRADFVFTGYRWRPKASVIVRGTNGR